MSTAQLDVPQAPQAIDSMAAPVAQPRVTFGVGPHSTQVVAELDACTPEVGVDRGNVQVFFRVFSFRELSR